MQQYFLLLAVGLLSFCGCRVEAQLLVGTPYVAATLEPQEMPVDVEAFVEPLIVKLDGVDCTTYVEYVTAARLAGKTEICATDTAFLSALQQLRYRHGQRGNYATRKHYFSEWISDAVANGLLYEVTPDISVAEPLNKKIDFMSSHPQFYPQLEKSEKLLEEIRKVEKQLCEDTVYYVPTVLIAQAYQSMQHGDIVAFLTNREGLDIQHVGLVWYPEKEQEPRLLHASSSAKQVIIDKRTIGQYAASQKNIKGIRIVRCGQMSALKH